MYHSYSPPREPDAGRPDSSMEQPAVRVKADVSGFGRRIEKRDRREGTGCRFARFRRAASTAGDWLLLYSHDAIIRAKGVGYLVGAGDILRPGAVDEIFVFVSSGRQFDRNFPRAILAFFHGH